MAAAESEIKEAPRTEIGTALPNALPSWLDYGRGGLFGGTTVSFNETEHVPELRWPRGVRDTYPRMATDSQLKSLERGTILPITQYAWGIDPNGAPPKMVEAACADFNLLTIDDALEAAKTGRGNVPIGRARNRFSFHRHLAQALKALRYGHYPFEQVGEIRNDGRQWGAPQDEFWHLTKLAPRPPRSLTDIRVANDGGLLWIRQNGIAMNSPPIEVDQLVFYVWDPEEDPGDWLGTSMFRSCYREWIIKDRLLRVDAQNHENAGGRLVPTAPPNATEAERASIAAAAARAGQPLGPSTSFPAGTEFLQVRASNSDVIASINRHDEAMTRSWMMMVIQLASTSHGSRAVGDNFESLLGIFQEGIAGWACDTFNEHVLEDWVDWNYGPDVDLVPRLAFIRPEELDVSGELDPTSQDLVANDPAVKAAIADAIHGLGRRTARASVAETSFRREPTEREVLSAADFKQIDKNWQSQVDKLVAQWQSIRDAQVAELAELIAGGADLAELANIAATAAGGDLIAARLKAMAQLGASEAVREAAKQGVDATHPDLAELETDLEQRAAALEQLLANSLSQAAANKAVQLSGGTLEPEAVAAQVSDYLGGLTDTYLADQFSGALSAAQNTGRLAAMDENGATTYYASELLDTNTCEPCEDVDGTEYATAAEAAQDYPAGGYRDCQGGPRCRGTVVAIYDEAAPSTSGGEE